MGFFSGSVVKNPSLSCFADTETPIRWNECCPQTHSPQISWNQKGNDSDSQLLHHQPIRSMSTSWSCPLWNISIKLLTIPSRSGHSFDSIRPLWSGNTIKLFFSSSPKTLPPRFNSTRGYRGWIQLHCKHQFIREREHFNTQKQAISDLKWKRTVVNVTQLILKQTKETEYKFKFPSAEQVRCKMLLWVILLWAIVFLTQLSVWGQLLSRKGSCSVQLVSSLFWAHWLKRQFGMGTAVEVDRTQLTWLQSNWSVLRWLIVEAQSSHWHHSSSIPACSSQTHPCSLWWV